MLRRASVVDDEASVCQFHPGRAQGVLAANGQEVLAVTDVPVASPCLPAEKFSVGRFEEVLLPLLFRESEPELSIHAPQTV
jgi:hypothetical protein